MNGQRFDAHILQAFPPLQCFWYFHPTPILFWVAGNDVDFTHSAGQPHHQVYVFQHRRQAPFAAAFTGRRVDIQQVRIGYINNFSGEARLSSSPPNICMPMGSRQSKMSSFFRLLMASRINPSLLMNSVYIRSAPWSLQTARKGGSLTSSMGASKSGKSGGCI